MRFTRASRPTQKRDSASASASASFTPSIKVHCSSTVRGARNSAARSSSRLHLRATGKSALRCPSSIACSETASCALVRAYSSSIRGTIPTVLTVILRSGTANPEGSRRTAIARRTSSRLSSGSPIPMNTTLAGRAPRWREAIAYCATISAAARLRWRPSRPVSQNTQPRAQPACEERHTVQRSLARSSEAARWMRTVSTIAPAARWTAKRTVPSSSGTASAGGRPALKGAASSSACEGRSGAGRPAV